MKKHRINKIYGKNDISVKIEVKNGIIRIKNNNKVKKFFNRHIDKKNMSETIITFFNLSKGDNETTLSKIKEFIDSKGE